MFNLIHINLSGVNLKPETNLNFNTSKLNFEKFLSDFFKLLNGSRDINENFSAILMSCLIPYLNNLDKLTSSGEINGLKISDKNLQNSLYELIKFMNQATKNSINEVCYPMSNDTDKILSEAKEEIKSVLTSYVINVKDNIGKKVKIEQDFISEKSLNSQNTETALLKEKTILILKELPSAQVNNEFKDEMNINSLISNVNTKDLKENILTQSSFSLRESSSTHACLKNNLELPILKMNELSQGILKALATSNKTLLVQLEPPELGKILIKLTLDNYGVKADMRVEYPHVKEMLTNLLPEIRSNLQSSGIKISDFLLDLTREHKGYSDSSSGSGQKKYRGNQKFFEYFV